MEFGIKITSTKCKIQITYFSHKFQDRGRLFNLRWHNIVGEHFKLWQQNSWSCCNFNPNYEEENDISNSFGKKILFQV